MTRRLYKLTITDAGYEMLPSYADYTTGGVVAAVDPKRARALMETMPGDEPDGFWLVPRLTTCRAIGRTNLREGVVFSGFHGV